MTQMLAHPKTQHVIAFRWNGQPLHEWPSFARESCVVRKDEDGKLVLIHERRSGKQHVNMGEWLVKVPGIAEADFYYDWEFRRKFEVGAA